MPRTSALIALLAIAAFADGCARSENAENLEAAALNAQAVSTLPLAVNDDILVEKGEVCTDECQADAQPDSGD